MIRIGLTGGIAVGKSTATAYLRQIGYHVIDADDVSRAVVQKGMPALAAIQAYFGSNILMENGELNRPELARRIFSSEKEREALNAIMFPAIWKEVDRQLKAYERRYPAEKIVFVDAAVLLESGGKPFVDCVWLVNCDEALQIQRLMERNHLNQEEAEQRMKAQWPFEKKAAMADKILENNEKPQMLFQQICDALKEIHESRSNPKART